MCVCCSLATPSPIKSGARLRLLDLWYGWGRPGLHRNLSGVQSLVGVTGVLLFKLNGSGAGAPAAQAIALGQELRLGLHAS